MKRNLLLFALLLVVEIAIAKFYFTEFIRHVVGDVLIIPLLYYLLRAITKTAKLKSILLVLCFAFFIEFLQWIHITEIVNITNPTLRIITGTTFDYRDLIAYTVGALILVITEKIYTNETH